MAMSFKLHFLSVHKTWPPTLLYKVTTHSTHMPAIVRPPDPYILTGQMTLSLPHSLFLSLSHTAPSISFNSILESWPFSPISFYCLFLSLSHTLFSLLHSVSESSSMNCTLQANWYPGVSATRLSGLLKCKRCQEKKQKNSCQAIL